MMARRVHPLALGIGPPRQQARDRRIEARLERRAIDPTERHSADQATHGLLFRLAGVQSQVANLPEAPLSVKRPPSGATHGGGSPTCRRLGRARFRSTYCSTDETPTASKSWNSGAAITLPIKACTAG